MTQRTLIQFAILHFLLFYWTEGADVRMTTTLIFYFFIISILLACLFEAFDHFISLHSNHKYRILSILCLLLLIFLGACWHISEPLSTYQKSLGLYIFFVLFKDTLKIFTLNQDLISYQQSHLQ